MTSTSGSQEIARRYARAFLSLAGEQGHIEHVAKDMQQVKAALAEVPEFAGLASNASLRRAQQVKAVAAVGEHLGVSSLTAKLLGTLAENRRLAVLPAVVEAVLDGIAQQKGIVTAHVTVARDLDTKQAEAIAAALGKKTGATVKVEVHKDPAIMGGLVVRMGAWLIDSSVRSKLDRLTRALQSSETSSDKKSMKEVA